ncbi:MAG: tetratricopeptide repeat protein [Thermodesulfobacteriota bacterium]
MEKKFRPELTVILILIAVTLATYLQAITFELVHAEDYVIYNELGTRLKAYGFPLMGIFRMPSNAVYLVPIPNFVAFLDIWLFGDRIGMLHLMNVIAHVMNSVLVFMILRLASGCLWQSAFVAALFALHPVNTENVVSWCRGPTLIETFFFLLTVLSYIYYARKPSKLRYGLIVLFMVLALLSKPSIVFLFFTLLLFDFWPMNRRRFGRDESVAPRFAPAEPVKLITEKMPLLIVPVVWVGIFALVVRMGPDLPVNIPRPDNQWHLLNLPVSYVLYLWKMVCPSSLPLHFPDSPLARSYVMPAWQIGGAAVLLALITAAVIHQRKRHPFLLTGWLWFVICLGPYALISVSQQRPLVPRYSYLPMIGLSIIAAWGGATVLGRMGVRRLTVGAAAVIVLVVLAVTSWTQAGRWADKISYFKHAVDVFPGCEQRRSNLGEVLYEKGRIDEAITQLEMALKINPDFFVAHNHLGLALMQRGDRQGARDHFEKAIRANPDYPEAHNNLANLMADMGDTDGAVAHYNQALRIDPSLFRAHNNLATVLLQKGLYDQAIFHWETALSLNPGYHTARENLIRARQIKEAGPRR